MLKPSKLFWINWVPAATLMTGSKIFHGLFMDPSPSHVNMKLVCWASFWQRTYYRPTKSYYTRNKGILHTPLKLAKLWEVSLLLLLSICKCRAQVRQNMNSIRRFLRGRLMLPNCPTKVDSGFFDSSLGSLPVALQDKLHPYKLPAAHPFQTQFETFDQHHCRTPRRTTLV